MLISALLLGFGIPSISKFLAILSSLVGLVPLILSNKTYSFKARFFRSTACFTVAYAIQLVWMLTHPFLYIYPAWALLSVLLALQMAIPISLLSEERLKSFSFCALTALIAVLIEYGRLYILCGYSLYPLGITLTGLTISRLSLIYLGTSGLTFIVFFSQTLLCRYKLLRTGFSAFLFVAILPYFGGALAPNPRDSGSIIVGIIDTNEFPEMVENPAPLIQTAQTLMEQLKSLSARAVQDGAELIVAPEIYVPFAPTALIYSANTLSAVDIAHEIVQSTKATLLMGLEGRDIIGGKARFYNSAYLFSPGRTPSMRYDKQVLVPLGEYIPFNFLEPFLYQYGITGAFTHGNEPVLFPFKTYKIAPSICYEETFSNIIINQKRLGADLLVNFSNDNWFPSSRLKVDHFEHARIVSTSLGCPLIRATNMGISTAVDVDGNVIPMKEAAKINETRLLEAVVPIQTRKTPFELIGVEGSIALLALFTLIMSLKRSPSSKKL